MNRYDWKYMQARVVQGKTKPKETLLQYILRSKKEMDDEINRRIVERMREDLKEGEDEERKAHS